MVEGSVDCRIEVMSDNVLLGTGAGLAHFASESSLTAACLCGCCLVTLDSGGQAAIKSSKLLRSVTKSSHACECRLDARMSSQC